MLKLILYLSLSMAATDEDPNILAQEYLEQGYFTIRNLFTDHEVDNMVRTIQSYVDNEGELLRPPPRRIPKWLRRTHYYHMSDFRRDPQLQQLFAEINRQARMHSVLEKVFGGSEAYHSPQRTEISINRHLSWHRDRIAGTTLGPLDLYWQGLDEWDELPGGEKFAMAFAMVYLQDHTADNRSLTLRPRSHLSSSGVGDEVITLHPRKGDLVVMDFRLFHRGDFTPTDASAPYQARMQVAIAYGRKNAFSLAWDRGMRMRNELDINLTMCGGNPFLNRCVRKYVVQDLRRDPMPPFPKPVHKGGRAFDLLKSFAPGALAQYSSPPGNPGGFLKSKIPKKFASTTHRKKRGSVTLQEIAHGTTIHATHVEQHRRILVVGASRGIGLELATQYAEERAIVHATSRAALPEAALAQLITKSGGRVVHHQLDVTNSTQLRALQSHLEQRATAAAASFDVLIHSAAVNVPRDLAFSMRTNADAPFAVINALCPSLFRASRRPAAVCILTSEAASHKRTLKYCKPQRHNCSEKLRPYVVSKQALNDRFRLIEPTWRKTGVTAILMDPGWVKTEMGGKGAQIGVQESVRGIRRVLKNLRVGDAGKWFRHDGSHPAW